MYKDYEEDFGSLVVDYCCPILFSSKVNFDWIPSGIVVGEIKLSSKKTKYRGEPLVIYQKTTSEIDKNIQLEINRIYDYFFEEVLKRSRVSVSSGGQNLIDSKS
ncbi:MAG: hypothetical protein WCO84_02420 [bacterium]